VDARYWLPRRQEIEIRRSGSWMQFPARGIIRGRWEICCVQVNADLATPLFQGPEIVSLPDAQLKAYPFKGSVIDAIPGDVRLSENDDVRKVQEDARALVRADALARVQRTALVIPAASDLVRMNRVEGLAFGAGISRSLGAGFSVAARARFGTADHAFKESASVGWRRASGAGFTLTAHDDFRAAGDVQETSGLRNSIGAQEFGNDLSDEFRSRGVALTIVAADAFGARWSLSLARDQLSPLTVHAKPWTGSFQPAFAADSVTEWSASLNAFHARGEAPFGSTLQLGGSLSANRAHFDAAARGGETRWTGRTTIDAQIERPFGADRLVLGTMAAAVLGGGAPAQNLVFFGGPISGPGYDYHQFSADAGLSQRVEWRHPAWAVPLPLGRFGAMRMPVTLAPFAQAVWMNSGQRAGTASAGWHPSAGLGILTLFDAIRLDVARGFHDGRWSFAIDFTRDFWRIL